VGGPALNTRTEMFRAFTMLQCTRIHCFDGSHWMTIIRLRRYEVSIPVSTSRLSLRRTRRKKQRRTSLR
jgi:hypothetical protein